MKVIIITEGGMNVGFGHVVRCLSLYQAFIEEGVTPEFIINGDETTQDLLRGVKYTLFNWLKKEEKILSIAKDADIMIVDSYLAPFDFYEKVAHIVKVPVYIDDNKRFDYPRGIIINSSISAEEMNYPTKEGREYLLGAKYTLLRKEFWDVSSKEIGERVKSIMITFGGDDSRNMTSKILKTITNSYPELIKRVIIGKCFQNIEEIENLKDIKTELIYSPMPIQMKGVMIDSDVAISAGGQTLYELARIGTPTVAVVLSRNQLGNVGGWAKARFIKYAGWWNDRVLCQNVRAALEEFGNIEERKLSSRIGRSLVTGRGPRLISETVTQRVDTGLS